jgi:hypothetical protein
MGPKTESHSELGGFINETITYSPLSTIITLTVLIT